MTIKDMNKEHKIFNNLYDAIDNTKSIENFHAVLTNKDFKKNFGSLLLTCNKRMIIELIDKKINYFSRVENINI